MKPGDLEVLKDFLLERMEPMDAWLVLNAAKFPDAVRVLMDRPVRHGCYNAECKSLDGGEWGEPVAHDVGCLFVKALRQLNHPNLQRVIDDEIWVAEGMMRDAERDGGYDVPAHWIENEETVDEHERRRGALLHPSVIAARRAGAAQEDIDDIIESIIEESNREPLRDPD